MLERGASPYLICRQAEEIGESGVTALHVAAGAGSLELVKFIVEGSYQPDIDTPDYLGQTPLHWACRNGHFDTVAAFLVAHGANINATCEDTNQSLLFDFMQDCQFTKAAKLIDLGADQHLRCGGYTALQFTCREFSGLLKEDYDEEVLEPKIRIFIDRLLVDGADIFATASVITNFRNFEIMEPLEIACLNHNVQAVDALLVARTRLKGLHDLGLHTDNFSCATSCVKYFLMGLGHHDLPTAQRIVRLLLMYASQLAPMPISTSTALFCIVSEFLPRDRDSEKLYQDRLVELAETLICEGADPRLTGEDGCTSFQHALEGRMFGLCDLMLRKGFAPSPNEIQTYWESSCFEGSISCLDYIFQMKKSAELCVKLRVTPADVHNLLVVEREWPMSRLEYLLLDQGLLDLCEKPIADLNSALHAACLEGSLAIAEKLLKNGADANSLSDYHERMTTPLLLVMFSREPFVIARTSRVTKAKLVDLLLQNGADILKAADLPKSVTHDHYLYFRAMGPEYPRAPISYAITQYDWEVLGLMFKHHPHILRKDPRATRIPYLCLAVLEITDVQGADRTIAELVRNGADPRAVDANGDPALKILLSCVGPDKEEELVEKSWVQTFPRMARMLWHDEIDVNQSAHDGPMDRRMSIGQIMQRLFDWPTKQLGENKRPGPFCLLDLYNYLATGMAKHFKLERLENKRFAIQLQPLYRPFG